MDGAAAVCCHVATAYAGERPLQPWELKEVILRSTHELPMTFCEPTMQLRQKELPRAVMAGSSALVKP